MTDFAKNFIGGEWVGAQSGATFTSTNPATLEIVAEAAKSGAEDVKAAVKSWCQAGPSMTENLDISLYIFASAEVSMWMMWMLIFMIPGITKRSKP